MLDLKKLEEALKCCAHLGTSSCEGCPRKYTIEAHNPAMCSVGVKSDASNTIAQLHDLVNELQRLLVNTVVNEENINICDYCRTCSDGKGEDCILLTEDLDGKCLFRHHDLPPLPDIPEPEMPEFECDCCQRCFAEKSPACLNPKNPEVSK